ncbi:hypothetical protein ACQPW3_21655 [Actinosynnema sp. CA-248983]
MHRPAHEPDSARRRATHQLAVPNAAITPIPTINPTGTPPSSGDCPAVGTTLAEVEVVLGCPVSPAEVGATDSPALG